MREELEQYMQAISLTTTLTARAKYLHDFYASFCPEEIRWMFINDYLTEQGERKLESILFFSESFAMESKNFSAQENYELALLQLPIRYLIIKKQDYEPGKATEKSRINMVFHLASRAYFEFKASRENCDYLWRLFQEYIVPRLPVRK